MAQAERAIRAAGGFLRRAQLLGQNIGDTQIRSELASRRIFRVRHGWYSVPDAPDEAVQAVRVGGRLTGISALASYGFRVPRTGTLNVAVARHACRLRDSRDRRVRLSAGDVRVEWVDIHRSFHNSAWRVPIDEALLSVVRHYPRDIAVACASAVAHRRRWSRSRIKSLFARAPLFAQKWGHLVSALDESHGETFFRLWTMDDGLFCEQQVQVPGAGRLDFRMSPHVFVEIDGGQHDPDWTGEGPSTYEPDHDRDATVALDGGRTFRFTYRQLYTTWDICLAGVKHAVADDHELMTRRARHPLPRNFRKRRRSDSARAPNCV
jgi:very-short-patch-repair endonuclease